MRFNTFTSRLIQSGLAASLTLIAGGAAFAQQVVNLTAAPATAAMPDGTPVPMWGYSCGVPVTPASGPAATCAALNPNAGQGWSPVVITVPYVAPSTSVPAGTSLTINLTNTLCFPNCKAPINTVPTSLTIVGQLGGGLGSLRTTAASPNHAEAGVTWSTVGSPGGNPTTGGGTFTAPPQGARVQSLATEVAATGVASPLTWNNLRPGTYLIESGTHPSIQGPMGLYGILVVTTGATSSTTGCAYPGAAACPSAAVYSSEVPLLLSEIDPVQNFAVSAAVNTAGFAETNVWSVLPGGCGNPGSGAAFQTCYPPAVNYTPLYYMFNGVAFNKTNAANSLFASSIGTSAAPVSGNVLVRLVNAGLRMHVPSIVGSQTTQTVGTTTPVMSTLNGFSILAEDGNLAPGVPKVQSDVFMAAGKTFDLVISAPTCTPVAPATTCTPASLPIYDRELSLSGNAVDRDAGMIAYIGVNGGTVPSAPSLSKATAVADTYNALVTGQTLTVSDPSKGVIANDTNVYGVSLLSQAASGTVTLAANGTFTYVPSGTATSDSFTYCANGTVSGATCSSGITATVTLGGSSIVDTAGVTCVSQAYASTVATYVAVKTPGVLSGCTDGAKLPLTVQGAKAATQSAAEATLTVTMTGPGNGTAVLDANGGFTATASAPGIYTFPFTAQNSQGTLGASTIATVTFPTGSGLNVTLLDGMTKTALPAGPNGQQDYRWVIEEDKTFYINPNCVQNPPPAGCPTTASGIVPTLGVNFHTSYMPFVAQGCTGPKSCEYGQMAVDPSSGSHVPVVCDISNGICRSDGGDGMTSGGNAWVLPGQVYLDPTKRYYLSVLPGDAGDPFIGGSSFASVCTGVYPEPAGCVSGHGMGGAPIGIDPNTGKQVASVTVVSEPTPFPTAQLSIFVFEDDFPLNGEHDGGGGVDVVAPNEPGLGGFQIHLWDAMGGNGDFTGQMTYDMLNQPLSNSLSGMIDPLTNQDACPVSANATLGSVATGVNSPTRSTPGQDPTATGITGMIVTCPKYEADGKTLSPLAGQALVKNLMPMRVGIIATPAADRIARGEQWLQTNTLDGQKAHDAFARIGEPTYFQEFGPASYHVSIGFANPDIINGRKKYLCNGTDANSPTPGAPLNCNNTLTGRVTGQRLSRTPDERLYSTDTHDAFYWTQCYASIGDPDGEDFAFAQCDANGNFTLTGLPDGDWRVTTFDQWNDQLVDGLSTPVRLSAGANAKTTNMGSVAATQWEANLYTRTFIDDNGDGISQAAETGIPFANVAVRLRDGSLENLLVTDFTGTANFNETFPLFSWYVVETDVTRYKNSGTHVVYDAGGPADGSMICGTKGYPPCGSSKIGNQLANTVEQISVPPSLRVPGAVYCAGADCSGKSMQTGPAGDNSVVNDPPSACTTTSTGATTCSTTLSTGRIDPPWLGGVEGWQGFPGQNNFIEFGKEPYVAGENGGIKGHVVYASTRPFDDPQLLVQTQWVPLVPHVTINLYQEGFASDGVTPTLTLVDTTQTTSWDDWAQGFHLAADNVTKIPNMNCPGQGANTGPNPDLFFYSLFNQPQYLDLYSSQHGGAAPTPLPANSQFKCYDGMHNWNQIQPAPYDGQYQFPSVTSLDPKTGKPKTTNCKICSPDPVGAPDVYAGVPMLPAGKYVVEVVVPPGMELVKEEDKNILVGDNYIAPVTQEFGNLGNVFIIPDQASVAGTFSAGSGYNANNPQQPTQNLGASPQAGIVPGFVPEPVWPCVGEARVVPDYMSLFPQSHQVSPFAGATRRLCDRKEVTLGDQMAAIAKFYVFTSTHIASKFTGGITDDYTAEFDPFSPQFGEKFAPPDMPVSLKDWTGTEISRVYADHWGSYNGMTYSSWEVNPPNPTGYAPTMMVFCMNDPGPIKDTRVGSATNGQMITDPLFTQGYSQFCYELPFMPGTTQYLDTPVVPTSAFAGAGYNNVDCAEPDATPAIASVKSSDIAGPWVQASGAGHTLTIAARGDEMVPNYAYSGPGANTAPFNTKTIKRSYNFGSTPGTVALVGSDGVPHLLTDVSWGMTSITGAVPAGLPNCVGPQQQALYAPGATTTKCGQLVITAANGKQSIDAITVTVGGKKPTVMASGSTIQAAIDKAAPGDMIIVPPGTYTELLLMWKPVRLQGVGAASSIVNANTHPSGKLTPWRASVDCLFGLSLSGNPLSLITGPGHTNSSTSFDPTGAFSCPAQGSASGNAGIGPDGNPWYYFNPTLYNPQVDRIAFEGIVGWDASLNGNLAQLLQEPSLMGALEGAGITVMGKGVSFPADPFDPTLVAGFPTGTVLFTTGGGTNAAQQPAQGLTPAPIPFGHTPCDGYFPGNFQCNPSSIDGMGVTNSSQGGGGIFVHAWAHHLQISNNRIFNNAGTLSGGINLGQGEFPPNTIAGGGATNVAPGSCFIDTDNDTVAGTELPYCLDTHVNINHNYISLNNSTGDELFSATPAGSGGVSICTGSDYYKFNYNWVCGNLSNGDGGGLGHLGFIRDGHIEHNSILFNQSTNPTIPTNGGGIVVMGTPDADPTCGTTTDQDCVSALGGVGPSDGVGPGLVINANLIMGNAAESGSGGGIAFQNINGADVVAFPTSPKQWYSPKVTNNIIANNVAGWDGGGVSLLDALNINIVNNTIIANVTTASAGVLTNTLGAPLASTQNCPPGGTGANGLCTVQIITSTPQPSGLVSINNSAILLANLPGTITCPVNHYTGTANNGSCRVASYPLMDNNVFWQNSSDYIAVGGLSAQFQQNVVSLYNSFSNTLAGNQPATGSCMQTAANGMSGTPTPGYWDIGVRGDTGPGNHSSTITLAPNYSVLTNAAENGVGTNNLLATNPTVVGQYCNGSRQPPEACAATGTACGWATPPGISDATVPNPIFNLTPVATVDEGNNWINMRWGPLSLTNPSVMGTDGNYGGGAPLGNYAPAAGSPVIDYIPSTAGVAYNHAPSTDFFGNERKTNDHVDVGAVEFVGAAAAQSFTVTPALDFGNWAAGGNNVTSTAQILTVTNTGKVGLTGGTFTFGGGSTQPFSRADASRGGPGTCGATLAVGASCTYDVVFAPAAVGAFSRTLAVAYAGATGTSVTLTGTGVSARATLSITPNPMTITLQHGNFIGEGTVTLTNTAPAGGSQVAVTNVTVPNVGSFFSYFFAGPPFSGTDTCTGLALAPGASCTEPVGFGNFFAQRGVNRADTITFTDTGAGSPQTGKLIGHANP